MSKILIVDDSGLARRSLRKMLEDLGHSVDEAADGAEALERYFIGHHDVVFLDIVMQGMYGFEVLEKFRELNPEIRVIMATADIQTSTREHVQAAGAVGIVNKPFTRDALSEILATVEEKGTAWK
jgi:two-component system, chemotaxis family, chemotaxis protein CheY